MMELINNDCYEVLKDLEPIDFLCTDPPYFFKEEGGYSLLLKRKYASEVFKRFGSDKELDAVVDFSPFFERDLYTKGVNGAIFCTQHSLMNLVSEVESRGFRYTILIWHKLNPIPMTNNRYLSDVEYIVFFKEDGVPMYGDYASKSRVFTSNLTRKEKNKWKHPTIKPEALIEKLILNHTKDGEIVFDPFLGSGTTAVVANRMNRKCIGIEIDKEYFEIAQQRVNQATSQSALGL